MANKITIEISVDDKGTAVMKQFGQNSSDALKQTEDAAKKQSGIVDQLKGNWVAASAAIVAAWMAVNKIVGSVSDVTMAAARYETLGVVMRVVGNNAGYTGDQMEGFAKGLEKTGISMSGARESLTRMAQAQLDLNKASALARVAQDAAVIGSVNSSEAFQRLVYGIQSAQTEVLRTIGINVNFENSYKKVAEQTGRNTASFSEAEKSAIRMNAVLTAGKAIAGAYESAMDSAGKQLLSLERHFDNLKVLAGAAFTPALAEIVQVITASIVGLNKNLSGEEGKQAIQDWGTNFRINIISVEAEFMRMAMLIDRAGQGLSMIGMGLTGVGSALGIESSKKRFEAAAQMYLDYEKRYMETDKTLEALALKQIALERSLTAEGKAAAKAAEEAAEKKRMAGALASAAKKEAVEEQTAAEKSIVEAIRKAQIEIDAYGQSQHEKDLIRIDSEEEKWRAAKVSEVKIAQWKGLELQKAEQKSLEDQVKASKEYQKQMDEREKSIQNGAKKTAEEVLKFNKEKSDAERQIYKDMRQYAGEFYASELALINEQAAAYRKKGVNEVAIALWVAEETRKAEYKKAEYSNDFFEGVRSELQKMKAEMTSWGKAGQDTVKSFAANSKNIMSTIFFDAYKSQLKSTGDYFTAFTDNMAQQFFDTLSKMITEATIKEIVLFFKSSWTENGGSVLNIVSSVLGIASNFLSGSGGSGNSGGNTPFYGEGGTISLAYGGWVPGFASGGNSYANDTVRAKLSPDEYVVDRETTAAIASQGKHGDTMLAHINPAEAALLKALGGAGTINERTGLPQFFDFGSILNIGTGGIYGAISGDWGGTKDIWNYLNPGAVSAYKAYYSHDVWDLIDAVFDPITGPGITHLLNASGGAVNKVLPWVGELIAAIAPTVGAIVGGVVSYGNPAGAAGGAAAGSGFASKWNQETNKEALEKAAIVAAVTYVSQYAGQYAAAETGSKIAGKAATMATAYAAKYIINEALGSVLVSDKVAAGQLAVSFAGAQDNGLLSFLQQSMDDLSGRKYAFPAKNGLDYVPYDNFYIRGHEGEAMLNKQEADEWRSGKNAAGIVENHFHFNVTGDLLDADGFARKIVPAINKALKARVH
jgi:hypothetical protein